MLDPQGRREVLSVAHELNGRGMTVILITHFMEEVVDCDSVVVMSGGHIVRQRKTDGNFCGRKSFAVYRVGSPRSIALAQKLSKAGFNVTSDCLDAAALGGEVCLNLSGK